MHSVLRGAALLYDTAKRQEALRDSVWWLLAVATTGRALGLRDSLCTARLAERIGGSTALILLSYGAPRPVQSRLECKGLLLSPGNFRPSIVRRQGQY